MLIKMRILQPQVAILSLLIVAELKLNFMLWLYVHYWWFSSGWFHDVSVVLQNVSLNSSRTVI